MRRLTLSLLVAAACSSAPQLKADDQTAAAGAPKTSPANPPAAAVAGAQAPAGSAGQPGTPPVPAAQDSAGATAKAEPAALDETAMDRSTDPCNDFYQYACGGWLKKTPIPDDRASWGRAFSEIFQRNEALLHDILEKAAKGENDPADPYAQKVSDFYATCMDEGKAETASLAALQKELALVDAVKDAASLAKVVAHTHLRGGQALFGFGSQQDFKDATQVIGGVDQGGLGLPDRDFYSKDDQRMKDLRALYEDHVGKMLALASAGGKAADTKAQAKKVMALETALAKVSMDKVERRDPNKIYHRLERKGLKAKAPHFQWDAYFQELGSPEIQAINVATPEFFAGMDQLIAKAKPADLHTYLRWRSIEGAADTLGQKFVEERFRLRKALSGAKAILPRWKRCTQMTDRALGEALGRSFVTTTIGDDGKKLAKDLIQGIEDAFEKNLASVEWMDPAARMASLDKLKKINNKVGYPDKWRDYSALEIGRDSLFTNLAASAAFESRRDLAKIGKPVDRGEFGMSPPTVNAYYDPSMNEMVFPAGIMQAPFFKPGSPMAANHGGLGMVMGHELTHGFDDQGRQFDGNGNLHEWWSPAVNKAFNDRAACVARQYDGYTAIDDQKLNGKLTLGENIADIGGLKMALAALRAKQGQTDAKLEQEFFTGFAQTWCTNYRPEAARLQAQTDPHSTAQWRVNGSVSDNPDFAKAFSCKAGSAMAPADRCVIW